MFEEVGLMLFRTNQQKIHELNTHHIFIERDSRQRVKKHKNVHLKKIIILSNAILAYKPNGYIVSKGK